MTLLHRLYRWWYRDLYRAFAAEAEVRRLKIMIRGAYDHLAAAHDVIARNAERRQKQEEGQQ